MKQSLVGFALISLSSLLIGCDSKDPGLPDLPKQSDRWVSQVTLDRDSVTKYVGKTKDYVVISSTEARTINGPRSIKIGDVIEGIQVGAIKCMFFQRDASYGRDQYMWRGRWGCQAGRSQEEILNAVKDDGTKLHDYIYIRPVRLPAAE